MVSINETCAGGFGLSGVALVLGLGILLLVAGKPWPLIIALLLYIVAFSKIGCLSQH